MTTQPDNSPRPEATDITPEDLKQALAVGPGLNAGEPAPQPLGNSVWPLVIVDMMARDRMGRQKYGTPLGAFDGRRSLVDAYQETLDQAVYLRKAIAELPEGAPSLDSPMAPPGTMAAVVDALQSASSAGQVLGARLNSIESKLHDVARDLGYDDEDCGNETALHFLNEVGQLGMMQKAVVSWQRATFGKQTSVLHRARHLVEEAEEVASAAQAFEDLESGRVTNGALGTKAEAVDNLGEELADVFMLLCACADRAGIDLAAFVDDKLAANKERTWKAPDEQGRIKHEDGSESPTRAPGVVRAGLDLDPAYVANLVGMKPDEMSAAPPSSRDVVGDKLVNIDKAAGIEKAVVLASKAAGADGEAMVRKPMEAIEAAQRLGANCAMFTTDPATGKVNGAAVICGGPEMSGELRDLWPLIDLDEDKMRAVVPSGKDDGEVKVNMTFLRRLLVLASLEVVDERAAVFALGALESESDVTQNFENNSSDDVVGEHLQGAYEEGRIEGRSFLEADDVARGNVEGADTHAGSSNSTPETA